MLEEVNTIYNNISSALTDKYLQAGIGTAIFSFGLMNAKNAWYSFLNLVDRMVSTKVLVNSNSYSDEYSFVDSYFTRENDYSSVWNHSEVGLGYGKFYRWFNYRPVVITKTKIEQQNHHYNEISVKTWFNKKLKQNLIDEEQKLLVKTVLISSRESSKSVKIEDRFIPTASGKKLYENIKRIKELWNAGYSIKSSFLLYGEPGSGKSKSIQNICITLGIPIKIITFNPETTNGILVEEVSHCDKYIILIEDIDRYSLFTKEVNENEKCNYNKAGILNMLDGILSPESVILIGTTNNIDVLDPAIVRSGRFDNHIEFTHPTEKEVCELFIDKIGREPTFTELESLKTKPLCDIFKDLNDLIIKEVNIENIDKKKAINSNTNERRTTRDKKVTEARVRLRNSNS